MLFLALLGILRQASAAARPDYPAFKIITDRNIFNTKRSPKYVPPAARETRRIRATESFALTGTMRDEKGPLAFFDGSAPQYRKVLKPEETIAGFTVAAVEHGHVKLKNGTNEITLPVNMQMSREEQGEWQVSARAQSVEAPPVAASSSSAPSENRDRRGDRSRDRRGETGRNNSSERGTPPTGSTESPPPPPAVPAEPGPATISNAAPAAISGGTEADILELLRRRREQENN
jgi:hypothetical protein